MDFFINSAWAQEGADPTSLFGTLPFLIILFVVFYFLLIRPQTKRQKEHRKMVEALSAGDEVITGGGVLGKIINIGEQFVTVEIADGVVIKVQKHTVGALLPKGTIKEA